MKKIFNSVTNSSPLFAHGQGSVHKVKEWQEFCDKVIEEQKELKIPNELKIVTFKYGNIYSCLDKQLDKFKIPYINLCEYYNHNEEWKNYFKIIYFEKYLNEIDCEYILSLDSLDVLLCDNISSLIEEFKKFNCDILFGSTVSCFPHTNRHREDDYQNKPFAYLNAGTMIGKVSALKVFYKDLLSTINKEYGYYNYSEQTRIRDLRLKYSNIKADVDCKIFQTLYGTDYSYSDGVITINNVWYREPEKNLFGFAATEKYNLNTTYGGRDGETVLVSNSEEFIKYISSENPYIIKVFGEIILNGMCDVKSNKTIEGVENAIINGGGLNIGHKIIEGAGQNESGVRNIIIKNITFKNSSDDAINIQMFSHHIWIDHCDFSNAFDGLIDIKRGSDLVTISYCKFHNHVKTILIGHNDNNKIQDEDKLNVTLYCNWFKGTNSRHPRVRFGKVHCFNNFYDNNLRYGIGRGVNCNIYSESNYFLNVQLPYELWDNENNLGYIFEDKNIYDGCGKVIKQEVPENLKWEPKDLYGYRCFSLLEIKKHILQYVGPQ